MMARRERTFQRVCELVGPGQLAVVDIATGWPGSVNVATSGGAIPVSLHVGTVGPHNRKVHEYRFQNPGDRSPVQQLVPNSLPILLGLHESDDGGAVFVALSGESRLGRDARFSILFDKRILQEAATRGWGTYKSHTGESIHAFRPAFLPPFIESISQGVEPCAADMTRVASAAGLLSPGDQVASAERARRAASALIRDQRFSRDVKGAYGERCAMCGLGLGLVVGAHIYPASAPGAADVVSNGVALCQNHHAAFDAHWIHVDPATFAIRIHPQMLEQAEENDVAQSFVRSTRPHLLLPEVAAKHPRREMFERRYEYYQALYGWVA